MTPLALPGELSRDKTDRLRPPPDQPAEEEVAPEPAPAARPGPRRRAVGLAKGAARQLLGERGVDKLRGYLRVDEALRMGGESLRRTAELEQQVASMQRYALGAELVQAEAHAASINLELLKGEVRSVIQTLEDLGMAIAPAGAAGPAAIANMFSCPARLSCCACCPDSTAPSRICRSCARLACVEAKAPHLMRASMVPRVTIRRSTRSVKS